MATSATMKDSLAERIAGEIVLSKKPEATLRKWRDTFNITQSQTAQHLRVSPSVISDYESGRRTPGTHFIKKFVEGIIAIDIARGGRILNELLRLMPNTTDAIIDMREFPLPVKAIEICQAVNGVVLACSDQLNREIYGYTIIDSVKAIQTLSGTDFYQLFGSTTERAAVFTNVTSGRSPMVAMRVNPLKPKMVVIQGPKDVDSLAVKLAELERTPLILSKIISVEELINALAIFYGRSVEKAAPKKPS